MLVMGRALVQEWGHMEVYCVMPLGLQNHISSVNFEEHLSLFSIGMTKDCPQHSLMKGSLEALAQ